jgi:hypothetical protein
MGGKPRGGLVQVGRRLRKVRDDRAHGGLGEFGRRALVDLRPQLHLDERLGGARVRSVSAVIYTRSDSMYNTDPAET